MAELAAALLTFGVAIAALLGIGEWRNEHADRRRVELAEDALVHAFKARDAIAFMRHPASLGSEVADIVQAPGESAEAYGARRTFGVAIVRHNQNNELFGKLQTLRYLWLVFFGADAAKPMETILDASTDVVSSARHLMMLHSHPPDDRRSGAAFESWLAKVREKEAIVWSFYSEPDPIAPKVDAALAELELQCQALLRPKTKVSLWQRLTNTAK
jgi:hypothetical protein